MLCGNIFSLFLIFLKISKSDLVENEKKWMNIDLQKWQCISTLDKEFGNVFFSFLVGLHFLFSIFYFRLLVFKPTNVMNMIKYSPSEVTYWLKSVFFVFVCLFAKYVENFRASLCNRKKDFFFRSLTKHEKTKKNTDKLCKITYFLFI